MAKRKKKEITCSVTITEGASERLTKALVKIHYQRKRDEEMRELLKEDLAEEKKTDA